LATPTIQFATTKIQICTSWYIGWIKPEVPNGLRPNGHAAPYQATRTTPTPIPPTPVNQLTHNLQPGNSYKLHQKTASVVSSGDGCLTTERCRKLRHNKVIVKAKGYEVGYIIVILYMDFWNIINKWNKRVVFIFSQVSFISLLDRAKYLSI
jgi:hypothetical protein